MAYRRSIVALGSLAALLMTAVSAAAFDESKYPNLKGTWERVGPPRWVQAGQTAPLTPEYQKIFEWNTADQKAGGHGWGPSWVCLPPGVPRTMKVFRALEVA